MSLANIPVNLQMDPVLVQGKPEYTITKGPAQALYRPYVSQNYSESTTTWDIIPNNETAILARDPFATWSMDLFLRPAIPGDGPIFPPGSNPAELGICGLKSFPMQSACSAINLILNGTTITYQGNQIINPLSHYRTDQELECYYWSAMPCQKNVGTTFADTYGTPMSQFAPKNLNPVHDSNAVLSYMEIINDDANGCLLRVTWDEYLVCPPFLHNKIEQHGLSGLINNISFQFIYSATSLAANFGYDNVNGKELASVEFVGFAAAPILSLKWYELPIPPADSLALHYKYPFVQSTPLITNVGIVPALAQNVQYTSASLQFQGIPSDVAIFVRRTLASRTSFTADSYASIRGVSITWNNMAGILSTASTTQLYELCTNKHIYIKYDDWRYHVGSVLKLAYDKDIPIPQLDLAVGCAGVRQFQVTVNFDNLENEDINYDIVVIPIYEGILTIHGGSSVTNINLVTTADLISAASKDISSSEIHEMSALKGALDGGSIFSQASKYVARGAKSVANFYSQNKDTIHKVIDLAKHTGQTAAQLMPLLMLAAGLHENDAMDMLEAAGFSAGGFSGGKLISDEESLIEGSGLNRIHNRSNITNNSNHAKILSLLTSKHHNNNTGRISGIRGGNIYSRSLNNDLNKKTDISNLRALMQKKYNR